MTTNAEFLKALLKLRHEIKPPVKSTKGHNYKYADLAEVCRVTEGPLHDNGFVLLHAFRPDGESLFMDTTLMHEHGQLTSSLPLSVHSMGNMNAYQSMGSAITYLRRYAVMALLGLPAEDDDGQAAGQAADKATNGKAKAAPPAEQSETARLNAWVPQYLAKIAAAQTLDDIETVQSTNSKGLVAAKARPALKRQIEEATKKRIEEVATFPERADREIGPLESEPLTPETPF